MLALMSHATTQHVSLLICHILLNTQTSTHTHTHTNSMHLFLVKVSDDREERRAWREQIMMIRGRGGEQSEEKDVSVRGGGERGERKER